ARAREIADRCRPVRGSDAPRVHEQDAGPGREAGPRAAGGLERRGDTRRIGRHVWLDEAARDQDERADGVAGPEDVRSGALRLGEEPVQHARTLRLLGVEDGVHGDPALSLERTEDRLGDDLIDGGVRHDPRSAAPAGRRGEPDEAQAPPRHESCPGRETFAERASHLQRSGAALRSSKWVTESALVHTPTFPGCENVESWASITLLPSNDTTK